MTLAKKVFSTIGSIVIIGILLSFSFENRDWNKYLKDYKIWKEERVSNLKKPMGYLSMTGLYWISEGENRVGSEENNDIVFPPTLPEEIGVLSLQGDKLKIDLKTSYNIDDKLENGSVVIRADVDGKPSMFNKGSNFWYVIKRGDQYGIRMKDTLAQSRLNFESMPSYDPKEKWLIKGVFKKKESQKIQITNKVGITYDSDLAGVVSFLFEGKAYNMTATYSGKRLFVVFADLTNGMETYGGGRFLYIDLPEEGEEEILIDFNKVENPICAISDYATCPLPRPENYLDFKVEAGEKKVR